MLFSLPIQLVVAEGLFAPSIYDPRAESIKPELLTNTGFLTDHSKKMNGPTFGNLSILSVNLYNENLLTKVNQRVKTVYLVDQHHPSILTLQAASGEQLTAFKAAFEDHYVMVGDKYIHTDLTSRQREYRPIFFDKEKLELINEGKFEPSEPQGHAYATYAIFRMKNEKAKIFIVINADLYSANATHIEDQMYNMLKHIGESPYAQYPLIFAGMINEQSDKVKKLIKTSLKNTTDEDKNNTGESRGTFHYNGRLEDRKQRDFILKRDDSNAILTNYSRILNRFEKKDILHYPIYAVFTA